MNKEQCYGIIPLKKIEGKWHVLLLLHAKGSYWGFPKGHQEIGESEKEAAIRELNEETSLQIKEWMPPIPLQESYELIREGRPISKTVTYFMAEVEGALSIDHEEILGAKWAQILKADREITYPESKVIMKKVAYQLEDL